ncbi:Tetratricopeptide repeat protein 34 [Camelus dromedarius]|uniref:Tetratricopeptide repeat protein 34 n=1 Tax=Camelus dromedarius TaxID=9838 RepID=A0A5N4DBK7_CAMDR|nr:Tetratricopeptide repeat protein 34 [Camelus dromedarius]
MRMRVRRESAMSHEVFRLPPPGAARTGHGPITGAGVMSAQELVACLCREGDQHLALGETPLATAFYLAAFSCHAPSAVRRVRAALAEARGLPVVATLEAWCRGDSQIPAIHWDGMAVVSLTGTLASAFLATLCPDHPATVLHSLAGLLARGRHGEVARRCSALLDAQSQQALELQLTRALAWVLSGTQVDAGVADYLRAFASSADRTVAFIHTHQQTYLPTLVGALQDYISQSQEARDSTSQQETDCQGLLAALDPGGIWRDALSPEALLRGGRYEDCRAACSRALEVDWMGSRPREELETNNRKDKGEGRGGGGEKEEEAVVSVWPPCWSLALPRPSSWTVGSRTCFRTCTRPSTKAPRGRGVSSKMVLSAGDQERVRAQAQEAADLGFAHFQEAVRRRPELREDSGHELLAPVTRALRVLMRVAPPEARPALGARLAECLCARGGCGRRAALCERLLRPRRPGDPAGDRVSLLALRGFCALHTGDTRRAQEDFQMVVELGPPHLGGCMRALCGRGLLRVLAGSTFLGALDYVTACRLRPEEALLITKAYVPWNQRGLLLTVLREEGRRMLQRRLDPGPTRGPGRSRKAAVVEMETPAAQEGDARGVYQLATLLMELDSEDEASRLLAADALYRLGRLDDAHKALLVALSRRPQAAPVLVRLALLQLRRGFFYDANQLVKKVIQSGDTACLQPTLDVFHQEDRQLLRGHCHARALAILRARPGGAEGEVHTREAIAYLSLAIFAAGSQASESLLARARCYGFLGQKKTAMFDFNCVLRAQPGNAQALCGRALLHLALDQQEEAVDDILSALKLDPRTTVPEIRSLKPEAQALITQGLSSRCRAGLSQLLDTGPPLNHEDTRGLLAAGEALIKIDAGQPSWHTLLADVLAAVGNFEEASARLQEALQHDSPSEAAQARRGLFRLKKGDVLAAARDLQCLAETDAQDLRFLLRLLDASERQSLTQVCTAPQRAPTPAPLQPLWWETPGPGLRAALHPLCASFRLSVGWVEAAAQEADTLLSSGQPGQALGYCSLAILAGGGGACHLRLRATCLAELQEFGRALKDLDHVLQEGSGDGDLQMQAEDLCSQGRLLLSVGDEARAAGAFAQALRLAPTLAQSSLWARPGRAQTARVLLCRGQRCLEEQRYTEAWTAAEGGLLVDPEHGGLRRLKARIRREASSGCRLH